MPSPTETAIPILLLKTKSTPTDAYEDLFSSPTTTTPSIAFAPQFVPVLQHRFLDAGISTLRSVLTRGQISRYRGAEYGGLIFTSQRAVEAFAKVYAEDLDTAQRETLDHVPIYSVGPATTRALQSISSSLQVWGSHTGNGEALAHYILDHYPSIPFVGPTPHTPPSSSVPLPEQQQLLQSPPPPLLFPVGEQRRDIIPNTLMDPSRPPHARIAVTEEVVYGTGVMESFGDDFARILIETADEPERWVVVFSPTGCEAMLRCLGLLSIDPSATKSDDEPPRQSTFVATIGPTTRDHLVSSFGFEPDVCAGTPSPQGVLDTILEFCSR